MADKKIFIADIETTGLLQDLIDQGNEAKLHNLAVKNVLNPNEEIKVFHANTEEARNELQSFLDNEMYLFMHNGIMYDSVALEILGFDVSKITFVDSYALSLYLYLERGEHGLESWGEYFGVPKPEIKDWKKLTQRDYDHRVVEDVKINYELYLKQKEDFCEIYGDISDEGFVNHKAIRYLNIKFEQLKEQDKCKIEIDTELCKSTIDEFTNLLEDKTEALKKVMPRVLVKKKQTRPKKPFLKTGELSATGLKWKEITDTAGVDFDFPHEIEVIVGTKDPNPNSSPQIKDWLFSLGWNPDTYKYTKDANGDSKAIAQVYIPSSGGELTESVLDLAEKKTELKELTGKSVIAHRLGVLKGFMDSIDEDNSVIAGASGFTNTLRLKHKKPMVNLPAYNKPYSSSIRSCIKAREGKIFFGADLSGLETILKLNYQMPYDPEFVKEQQSDDFDAHLAIAVEAGLISQSESDFYKIKEKGFPVEKYKSTEELKKLLLLCPDKMSTKLVELSGFRHIGKQANYSCQYNAGAKTVARASGISLKVASKVVKAYREKNWSINVIAENQTLKQVDIGLWLENPINGMWYFIKNKKDVFSTLVQGSGSFILDLWLSFCFKLRKERNVDFKLLATFHDEKIFELEDNEETKQAVKSISEDALIMVNNLLKLEIPIQSSSDFGYRYSDIH